MKTRKHPWRCFDCDALFPAPVIASCMYQEHPGAGYQRWFEEQCPKCESSSIEDLEVRVMEAEHDRLAEIQSGGQV